MNTAIAKQGALPDAIEAALMHGDLSKLDTPGRLQYYKAVCDSLGLNSLTRPFEYIVLNGKLTLYAKRDCAEQLRKIHGVTILSMKPEQIGDLLVVTVTAQDKTGRADSSTGAVPVAGLKGEALANAMMKAETKAKRRVTLSLCGLGLLDETEVDSIPDARPFREPELPPAGPSLIKRQLEASLKITDADLPAEMRKEDVFKIDGNRVKAMVVDAVLGMSKKKTPYVLVKIEGEIDGSGALYCYHGSLLDAALASKGNVCQFEFGKKDQWLYIEDVLAIGDQDYRDGKPYHENQDSEPLFRNEIPTRP